jgi:hypothetical protein
MKIYQVLTDAGNSAHAGLKWFLFAEDKRVDALQLAAGLVLDEVGHRPAYDGDTQRRVRMYLVAADWDSLESVLTDCGALLTGTIGT